jgi:hypothetical protein
MSYDLITWFTANVTVTIKLQYLPPGVFFPIQVPIKNRHDLFNQR